MNHTPGPWEHTGNGDIQGNEDNGYGMGPVDVCSVYLRTVNGRTEANARLITAAPELLAALAQIERICLPNAQPIDIDPLEFIGQIARGAIEKAVGGTK